MSKPVKNLIVETYKQRFASVAGAIVIDVRGLESNDNNRFRTGLAEKRIKVTVVKNSLAKRAFEGGELVPIGDMLDGSSAMVYPVGEETSVVGVARELMAWSKELPTMQFKGALMDGIVFGGDQIDALSKYPTREEAHAKVVQVLLSPAKNLAGAVAAPASNIAGILKAIQEKLEKGETIAAK